MLPFIDLAAQKDRLGCRIEDAINQVMSHGKYIMGPEVKKLEEQLAAYAGVSHCVTCANGTDALLLVLTAWGIRPGDAVFVPAFTFVATAEAVKLLGASPVFCDVNNHDFNISLESLEHAVPHARSNGLTPKAIISVDLFGQPADYPGINTFAAEHDLLVLADGAQSFGATLGSKHVGSLAHATTTSFFPAKPLGCYGDGGAIFTNDDGLAVLIRSLRMHGQGGHKYDCERVGLNSRLDTIQAAILIEKLAILDEELESRNRIAERYCAGLSNSVTPPRVSSGKTSAWAQYTIKSPQRDDLSTHLREAGIPSAVYYPLPLPNQTAYNDDLVSPEGLDISEELSKTVLSLPMHPYLRCEQQEQIMHELRRSIGD